MEDIGAKLLADIKKDFSSKYKKSNKVKQLLLKIKQGTATFEDAHDFSIEVGELLSSSYSKYITSEVLPDGRMYWNIAQTVLEPTLGNDYELVSAFSYKVQKQLNKKAGLGLNPAKTIINQDKVYGIMNKIANAENYDDVSWVLNEPIVNFSQSVVDDVIKKNVEFHYKSGLHPTITRVVMGNCCEWCRNLAGTYSYPNKVPKDIYRRHRDCRCMVLYDPKDKRGIQNSHTKKWENKSATIKNVKLNIQFFAQKDLKRQSETSIKRGIRHQNKQIEIHKQKISNPSYFYPEWNNFAIRKQEGLIKHWNKEIKIFEKNIQESKEELQLRKGSDGHEKD